MAKLTWNQALAIAPLSTIFFSAASLTAYT